MSNKKEPRIDHSVSPKRDILVVPPGARGPESMHPAHVAQPPSHAQVVPDDSGVKALDITKLVKRKEDEKRVKKKLEKRLQKQKQKEKGDVAGKAKNPESPLSSSSSISSISSISPVSLSPNEILAFEEEQRLEAKSVSPRLSPLVRGTGVGARARKKPSSSSSSSSSKSPKGRKPSTPKFEKIEARSLSPKARGKGKDKDKEKVKEGTKRQGGGANGTRKKYKRKLRKFHSRKRR
jgi:hypothetical protein